MGNGVVTSVPPNIADMAIASGIPEEHYTRYGDYYSRLVHSGKLNEETIIQTLVNRVEADKVMGFQQQHLRRPSMDSYFFEPFHENSTITSINLIAKPSHGDESLHSSPAEALSQQSTPHNAGKSAAEFRDSNDDPTCRLSQFYCRQCDIYFSEESILDRHYKMSTSHNSNECSNSSSHNGSDELTRLRRHSFDNSKHIGVGAERVRNQYNVMRDAQVLNSYYASHPRSQGLHLEVVLEGELLFQGSKYLKFSEFSGEYVEILIVLFTAPILDVLQLGTELLEITVLNSIQVQLGKTYVSYTGLLTLLAPEIKHSFEEKQGQSPFMFSAEKETHHADFDISTRHEVVVNYCLSRLFIDNKHGRCEVCLRHEPALFSKHLEARFNAISNCTTGVTK